MKTTTSTIVCLALLAPLAASGQDQKPNPYLSLKLEMERAIQRGNEFLKSKQTEEGYWGDPKTPALSALPLAAAMRDPGRDRQAALPPHLEKGFDWLISKQKDDGGIYGKGLASYNTASAIMALLARGREADEPTILKARAFLVNQQTDWGLKGEADNKYDGGTGYGGTYAHSDLSNTYLALEALYHSRHLAEDNKHGRQPELDWEAALQFVSRCQNLEATNDQEWASDNPADKGGFVYFPGDSKAGERDLGNGRTALRSYGSMSYAGLLSLVFADLDQDDPRVSAVLDWLGDNYTLEENPGLGAQGLYYYFHTMAKSLVAAQVDKLELPGGKTVDWRRELATLLVSTQNPDGSWINDNSRWWENDAILVTSYVVMALEQIYYSLPQ